MLVMKLTLLEGRSQEKKQVLARRLTQAAAHHLGEAEGRIRLIVYEVPRAHWMVGGVSLEEQSGR